MTDAPHRPEPELVTAEGPWGGPVYAHRGAGASGCLRENPLLPTV